MKDDHTLIVAIVIVVLLLFLFSSAKSSTLSAPIGTVPAPNTGGGIFSAIGDVIAFGFKKLTAPKTEIDPKAVIAGSNDQVVTDPTGVQYA